MSTPQVPLSEHEIIGELKKEQVLWSAEEAIKQITRDGLLDTIKIMSQPNWVIESNVTHTFYSGASLTLRAQGFVNLAIKLGEIKDPIRRQLTCPV